MGLSTSSPSPFPKESTKPLPVEYMSADQNVLIVFS